MQLAKSLVLLTALLVSGSSQYAYCQEDLPKTEAEMASELKEMQKLVEDPDFERPTEDTQKKMRARLSELLLMYPKNSLAYRLRSRLDLNLGDMKNAMADIESCLKLDPKDSDAMGQKAMLLTVQEKYKEAVPVYDAAIAVDGNGKWMYINRGSTLQKLGEWEKALADFNKVISGGNSRFADMATALKVQSLFELSRYQECLEACNIALTKELPSALLNSVRRSRGFSYYSLEKYKEAIADYDQVIKDSASDNERAGAYFLRGACYNKMGNAEKAIQDLRQARALGFKTKGDPPPDQVVGVDKELAEAVVPLIAEARKTLGDVKARYLKGLPQGSWLSVTTRLTDGKGREQVFVTVKSWNEEVIKGTLNNDVKLANFKLGDPVTVMEKDVIDWTIVDKDGNEEGNLLGKFIDKWIEIKKKEK